MVRGHPSPAFSGSFLSACVSSGTDRFMEHEATQHLQSVRAVYMACCCCCYVTSVVSDSVRPHRRQATRLPRLWDSPGKNTGVGCHFFLQCIKVRSENEDAQLCPTLRDPLDCSPLGFSIHGIFQAIVLEWVAIAFSVTWLTLEQIRQERKD